MDPIVIVIAIVVLMPLAVIWALARSSQLRGPVLRRESRRGVNSLVTDVLPEEYPEAEQAEAPSGQTIDDEPREPDSRLRD